MNYIERATEKWDERELLERCVELYSRINHESTVGEAVLYLCFLSCAAERLLKSRGMSKSALDKIKVPYIEHQSAVGRFKE